MMKQTISLVFWSSLALYCFAAATTEIPKECAVGTADYNETLCSETCTKDIHMNQSYCGNFTKPTATTQSQPQQQQEVRNPTSPPEVTLPQVNRNDGPSTPKIDVKEAESSGISLASSAVLSVSCFFFSYIFI